jgi:hypothetical protein
MEVWWDAELALTRLARIVPDRMAKPCLPALVVTYSFGVDPTTWEFVDEEV